MRLVILIMAVIPLFIFGQSVDPKCISCTDNQVDTKKGASAVGTQNKSLGANSLAAGYLNEATGDYSVAMPYLAKSIGHRSLAFGYNAVANGSGSVALGTHSSTGTEGLLSIAIGSLVSTNAEYSMVLGFGNVNSSLINDIENSLMIGCNSNKSTFFVGPASGIDKTGKVGIGNITAPTAKLHIKADNNEDASLKLEPTGTSYFARILLGDDVHTITAKPNNDLKFSTPTGKNFVFENGKVVTTGLLVSTSPGNGKLLQSDASGNAVWTDPAWTIGTEGNIYRMAGNVGIGTAPTTNRLEVSGTVHATNFTGNGSGLTNVPGDNLGNHIASQNVQLNGKWLSGDGGNEGIFVKNDGNVGIGTMNPMMPLDISKNISSGGKVGMRIINDGYFPWFIGINHDDYATDNALVFADYNQMNSDPFLIIKNNGGIGIGTDDIDPNYLVNINGKILAEELKIILNVPSSDYVFNKDYNLIPIQDIEKYISENNHLPEIPSAAEFKANGYEVGKMDDLLLRKVEELTLYIIQQQKEIEQLKETIRTTHQN